MKFSVWISICLFVVCFARPAHSVPPKKDCRLAALAENGYSSELARRFPEVPETSALANLPTDLQSRFVKAGDQLLLMGENWSEAGVLMYRAARLPESEIEARVQAVLDHYLDVGRAKGMSEPVPPPEVPLLAGPGAKDFAAKHNLAFYQGVRERMGRTEVETSQDRAYTRDLNVIFGLAKEIGDGPRAMEIALQMVRSGEYYDATMAAEAMKSPSGLRMIGMLALADFYLPNQKGHLNSNRIYDAIEALKRVTGPEKEAVNETLRDLAREITSPQLIAQMARAKERSAESEIESAYRHALAALRATGTPVGKRKIDSYRVEILTRIDDKDVIAQIQKIADQIYDEGIRVDSEDIIDSLVAIGDTQRLNRFGIRAMQTRLQQDPNVARQHYSAALDYFGAAGNKAAVAETVKLNLKELPPSRFDVEVNLGPAVALLGDTQITEALDAYVAYQGKTSDKSEARSWRRIAEKGYTKESSLGALVPMNAVETPSTLRIKLDQEQAIIEKLSQVPSRTAAQRRGLAKSGEQLLAEGNLWAAYEAFRDAGNRDGLMRVGDQYVATGNAHNAISPYMAAAHLPKSEAE